MSADILEVNIDFFFYGGYEEKCFNGKTYLLAASNMVVFLC